MSYQYGTRTVLATEAPYWLMVNGTWLHLEGVRPGVSRSTARPRSEWISTDGYRHVQQAPRAPREWGLEFEHATPEAMAALMVAVESEGDVWLLDEAAARTNMLAPRDCFGHSTSAPVVDCGGVPLRAVARAADHVVQVQVRAHQRLTVSAWTDAAQGVDVGTIAGAGVPVTSLTAPSGAGVRRVERVVTPSANGTLTVGIGHSATRLTSGLQVCEDLPQSYRWLPGMGTPCRVSVVDPEHTLERVTRGVGFGSWSVTVQEVGG